MFPHALPLDVGHTSDIGQVAPTNICSSQQESQNEAMSKIGGQQNLPGILGKGAKLRISI